ncbi:Piso0_001677 [Millerozyma farinosa CBS 7064]|uniref:Piso0_001677 protein n=1 Tax=Pichia sorbitophila (strain ATCC MYA-4447 / BCRC 22081 / CBS 7064 / NBRC 10061 / NRRL Y-12695) TaxID=559304 RepID=G8YLF3_PICSO|nr:Piso0_001677 [Millerozyma farinosa CBS 7064]
MAEKYQADFPNSQYLAPMNEAHNTNRSMQLDRLPTLGEILGNKTKSPVSLYDFYGYMRDVEHNVEYLDFWLDLVSHLNLCKHYVQGLRESIIRYSYNENRQSVPISERSKTKSVSSSVLLELILNDNFLEDSDSRRLSQFLRGDLEVNPKLSDLINQYETTNQNRNSASNQQNQPSSPDLSVNPPTTPNLSDVSRGSGKRVSSQSRLLEDTSVVENQLELSAEDKETLTKPKYIPLSDGGPPFDRKRMSSISPSVIEKLIRNTPNGSETNSFVTRDKLKESSQNLLLKYFVEDAEKNLSLPDSINNHVIKAIEVDGRDDPDVFNHVKIFVFNRLENQYLPTFLNIVAIKNINRVNQNPFLSFARVVLGFFLLLIAFWIAYIFIFLNYKKGHRLYIIIPFFLSGYCLISSMYLIDPVLAWLGYNQSFTPGRWFVKVEEQFIYRLLVKRSLWVMLLILLFTACFTILFSLVPGHRL